MNSRLFSVSSARSRSRRARVSPCHRLNVSSSESPLKSGLRAKSHEVSNESQSVREMEMASSEATLVPSSTASAAATANTATGAETQASTDTSSIASSTTKQRRGFFGRRKSEVSSPQGSVDSKSSTVKSSGGDEGDDYYRPNSHQEENSDWGVGDDIRMGLG